MTKKADYNLKLMAEQGARLKQIRTMLRLSRAYLAKKYPMPMATLKAWENGVAIITEKGLKRCIDAYRQEGMLVTREWILNGAGLSPRVSLDMGKYLASELQYPRREDDGLGEFKIQEKGKAYIADENTCILREAAFFKESYPHAIVLVISNNDMEPIYQIGDYVGGIFRYGKDIDAIVKRDCIVRLVSGEVLLRRLFKNSKGEYNLACINPSPDSSEMPIMFDAKIESAAPIIWHRMPNP